MKRLAAGTDVESYCARCKLDLSHVIVAMVGFQPRRVRCLTCGSEHVYRPPQRLRSARRAAGGGTTAARPRAQSRPLVAALDPAQARAYSPAAAFGEGDVLRHAKFGYGIVQRLLSGEKIEVNFPEGKRILLINRKPP